MRLQLGQLYDVEHSLQPKNLFFGEVLVPLEPLLPACAEVAVRHLAAKYEILRAGFALDGINSRMAILPVDHPCFEQAFDCRPLPPAPDTLRSVLADYVAESRKSMSSGLPPLFRYGLFTTRDRRHQRLVFIINHLICDGISSRILWREFSRAYRLAVKGETVRAEDNRQYRRLGAELAKRRDAMARQGRVFSTSRCEERIIDILSGMPLARLPVCLMANRITETRRYQGNTLGHLRLAARGLGLGLSEFFLLLFLRALAAEYGAGSVAITQWFAPHFIGDWQTPVHDLVGSAAFPVPARFSIHFHKKTTDAIGAMKQGLYAAMENAADYAAWYYAPVSLVERPKLPAISFNFVSDPRCTPDIIAYRLAPEEVRIGRSADEQAEAPISCDIETYGDMLELQLAARPDCGLDRLPLLLVSHLEKELLSVPARRDR